MLKELSKYFDSSKLLKMRATVVLSQKGSSDEVEKYLSVQEMKEIKERREITILDKTKKNFRVD